jgi:hypothetical protein
MWDGSLYGQLEASATLMACVTLCDCNGVLDMTPQAIAGRTGWPLDFILNGISQLEADDPKSRTPDENGQRLVRLDSHRDWGWLVVNYSKYRALSDPNTVRSQTRERVRKFRMKAAGIQYGSDCVYCGAPASGPDHVTPVTQGGVTCVPACMRCNQRKASRTLAAFLNDSFCDFLDHDRIQHDSTLALFVEWDGHKYKDLPNPDVTKCNKRKQVVTSGNDLLRQSEAEAEAIKTVGLDQPSWDRWTQYRRSIGKPIKAASILSAQRKLASFGTGQATAVEESIANGWQGLFAPKNKTGKVSEWE